MPHSFAEIRRAAIARMPFAVDAFMALTPQHSNDAPGIVCDDQWTVYYSDDAMDNSINSGAYHLCVEVIKLLQDHPRRLGRMVPHENGEHMQQIACFASDRIARAIFCSSTEDLNVLDGQEFNYVVPSVEHYFYDIMSRLPPSGGMKSPDKKDDARKVSSPTGQSGSSADGQKRDWENEKPMRQHNDWQSAPPLPPQLQKAQQQAIEKLAGYGDKYQASTAWAKEVVKERPIVRKLESLIRQFIESRVGNRFRRVDGRNRRQQQISAYNNEQIVLARDIGPKAEVIIVVDTSGSMHCGQSEKAMARAAGVLRNLHLSDTSGFFTGGTEGEYRGRLTPQTAEKFIFDGDGGTDMSRVARDAYLYCRKENILEPNLMVIITDGETPWHHEYVKYIDIPVVVCLVQDESDAVEYIQNTHEIPEHWHYAEVVS